MERVGWKELRTPKKQSKIIDFHLLFSPFNYPHIISDVITRLLFTSLQVSKPQFAYLELLTLLKKKQFFFRLLTTNWRVETQHVNRSSAPFSNHPIIYPSFHLQNLIDWLSELSNHSFILSFIHSFFPNLTFDSKHSFSSGLFPTLQGAFTLRWPSLGSPGEKLMIQSQKTQYFQFSVYIGRPQPWQAYFRPKYFSWQTR